MGATKKLHGFFAATKKLHRLQPRNYMPQAVLPPDEDLPLWSKDYRGMPNALARSALFSVSRSAERRHFMREVIAASQGITLVYTGEELHQDDEDVFLQVLHLAKEQKLGEDIKFTANSMILALGWTRNTGSYERLSRCMARMAGMLLELTVSMPDGSRVHYAGSLIGEFSWREKVSDDPLREWVVSLQKNIVKLFDPHAYSLLHWPTRMSLTPTAKWLHAYYSTHKMPFPVKVATLHAAMGSEIKAMRSFRAKLKEALALLVDLGFLLSASVDPKSDLVNVERAADRRRLE
jgi:hypothetical protein